MITSETLAQPLIARARRTPEQPALIFVNEDGRQERVSAGRFHEDAAVHAQALHDLGIKVDDPVILVLRHSRLLLSAFWGAIYLGAIPSIFPFLSEKLDPEIYKEQVRRVVAHAGARAVITFPEFKAELHALLQDLDCVVLASDEIGRVASASTTLPAWQADPAEKIAFLQHSSGTTGLQKGVAFSHRAVLNQIESYGRAIALTPQDVIVSWLPLYHDMGLIAGFVMPLVTGVPLVLLSPFEWVRNPKSLLWAIHEHKGTLCWLPNFAYNHSVRAIRDRDLEGLDLGRWRMAVNCSEPVRYDSQQLFLQRFAAYGFDERALASCYAMAENTFAVTQSIPGRPADVDWVETGELQSKGRATAREAQSAGATPFVSCGYPIEGTEIAICDAAGQFLPQRQVGEILIRSDCLMREYYRRPNLTWRAFLNGWYRSGDLGYLADGQLYVTGRKKDLIIIGGKNIYPQDLEAIAGDVAGVYPGRAVAFGVPDPHLGTEEIVMVCEVTGAFGDDRKKQIEGELRRRVVQTVDVTLRDVRLVDRRWVLKTSSGKIARSANREKYLGRFQPQRPASS